MTAITQPEIDQQVFDLYDEYCHGRIDRREFMTTRRRAGRRGAGDGAGAAARITPRRRPFRSPTRASRRAT